MKSLKQIREEYNNKFTSQVDNLPEEMMLDEAKVTHAIPAFKQMPSLLLFRRVTYKMYPNNQVVALYYSKMVDKYLSVPFGPTGNLNLSEAQFVEGKVLDAIKGGVKGAVRGAGAGAMLGTVGHLPGIAAGTAIGGAVGAYKGAKKALQKEENDFKTRLNELRMQRDEGVVGDTIEKGRKYLQSKVKDSKVFKAAQDIGHKLPGYENVKAAKEKFSKGDYMGAAGETAKSLGKAAATGLGVAGAVGLGALVSKVAGGGGDDSPKVTATGRTSGEKVRDVSGPKTYSSWEKAPSSDPITRKRQQIASLKENRISDLKQMIKEGIDHKEIKINGRTVTLNTSMAKRILEVYDSVNTKNKKIVEGMLNEDLESFKKLLNFSIRN